MMMKRSSLILIILASVVFSAQTDFEFAQEAYRQGRYKIAQIYLENFLEKEPSSFLAPEATSYLIEIFDQKGDFVSFFSYVNVFLEKYRFDLRSQELFNRLLAKLVKQQAFFLAYDYIRKYDYLVVDKENLENIGYGLYTVRSEYADSALSLCVQNDTVKILRAQLQQAPEKKEGIIRTISGIKGEIYLIEHYLVTGDTIRAFKQYREIADQEIDEDILYRFTKLALLFEKEAVKELAVQLRRVRGFSDKAALLTALVTGNLERAVVPSDKEEMKLVIQISEMDSAVKEPPSDINLDSILSQTQDTAATIAALSIQFMGNFYFDSLRSYNLMNVDSLKQADNLMRPYFRFFNTRDYARLVRARRYYKEENHREAITHLILSNDRNPQTLFLLGQSLEKIGDDPTEYYKKVIKTTRDSILYFQALKHLIENEFATGRYSEVVDYDIDDFTQDTGLIRIYLRSLARVGQKDEASALCEKFFADSDYELANYYGEYLIEKKKYERARSYYDSLVGSSDTLPPKLYYNWALIPFIQGDIETALPRFIFYVNNFSKRQDVPTVFFKIATINYQIENYDTARYFYDLASSDSLLHADALYNMLICSKKLGNWQTVIAVAEEILGSIADDEAAEMRFEIGYAYLRSGEIRKAVENLKFAAQHKADPSFYYWLGEAYMAKGDLTRALYQYQRIVDQFPRDEMWVPTGLYKIGIVYELMDEIDQAKEVYHKIIKKRGLNDTWGAEAQKRLEALENVK